MNDDAVKMRSVSANVPGRIFYSDGVTEVCLGDVVRTRDFFRMCEGSVVYVPGRSPVHSQMEHHGQKFVGVILKKGALVPEPVPEDLKLHKRIQFVSRGDVGDLKLPPEDAEF